MQNTMEKITGSEIYQLVKDEVEKYFTLCEDYVMEGSPLESSKYWFYCTSNVTELRVSKIYKDFVGHELERKMDGKWETVGFLF